ncbi:MAG TPA: cell division protein ZapA, partial [Candidatus Competibacteraceae bacterium]|nr:cell division protein ZapA [Candidatus Competibacteraceae bacterium]
MNQDVIGVTVQLLGIDYRIACRRDERAGLIAAAHHLDSKMREVRDHSSKLLSPDAIAVMSA